jgi:motility quorum-sensing regulator / GCU-specific mRNA interferase toxin
MSSLFFVCFLIDIKDRSYELTYLPNITTQVNTSAMEKRKPHCTLSVVHTLVEQGRVMATATALRDAAAMDFEFDDMLEVIRALTVRDFYKSMTTHSDHRVWQDVYQPSTRAGEVYLKLTVIDDVLIVSFKEL